MKLTGNIILVTGASSGRRRALAEALHDGGNRIIVTARRQALLASAGWPLRSSRPFLSAHRYTPPTGPGRGVVRAQRGGA